MGPKVSITGTQPDARDPMKCPEPGCTGRLRVRRSNCSIPGEHRRIRDCPLCGFSARSEEILTSGAPAILTDAVRAGVLLDLISSPLESLRDIADRWGIKPATVKRYKRSLSDARKLIIRDAQKEPETVLRPEAVITNRFRKPSAAVLDLTDAAPGE